MKFSNKYYCRGQSLVEAIIALGVLTIGFVALLTLLNKSLGLSSFVSDRNTATYLAAEGIEIVKNIAGANINRGYDFDDGFDNGSYEVSYDTPLDEDDIAPDNFNPGKRLGGVGQLSNAPVLFDENLGYNYLGGTPSDFIRTVVIYVSDPPGTWIKVQSIVRWKTKGGGEDEIVMEDYIFNWHP